MMDWLRSHLYAKLTIFFLFVTLLPMTIIWIIYVSEAKQQIIEENLREIRALSNQIDGSLAERMNQIKLDLNLLVRYEIFDDVLIGDSDLRIANFLNDKHEHMLYLGHFHVLNMKGEVIASTNMHAQGKEFVSLPIQKFYPLEKSKFSDKKTITFTEPIYSSFDRSEQIGFIALEYFGSNLINFSSTEEYTTTFFYNPKTSDVYGKKVSHAKVYEVEDTEGFFFTDDVIFSYQALKGKEFQGFYFFQAIDKSHIMRFYNQFSNTILFAMLFGLILVMIIGARIVRIITNPINELSTVAQKIGEDQDYSIRVSPKGNDEIAILGGTLNGLLEKVQTMIEQTQEESEERLRTLTQLIYIFNSIMHQSSQEDVLEVAREKLGEFLDAPVHIDSQKDDESFQEAISYADIHTQKKINCGYMRFENIERSDLEKQFLESIATMVGLQIERLHLMKEATSASEAKSMFISNMSHELRTPLNAILGFSQILDKKMENEKQKKMISNILTAGTHLLSLINDILDIAKIEAGKIDIHVDQITINALLDEVEVLTSKLATEKGLYFKVENDSSFTMKTDVKFLKQILVNQLSNAIKFTQEGGVTVKVSCDDSRVYFDIVDTGIGISEENLQKLFNEFTQIDNELQNQNKGTGLGLVLSRNLARELGGDLTLSSVEGEGSVAHVCVAKELI